MIDFEQTIPPFDLAVSRLQQADAAIKAIRELREKIVDDLRQLYHQLPKEWKADAEEQLASVMSDTELEAFMLSLTGFANSTAEHMTFNDETLGLDNWPDGPVTGGNDEPPKV